MLQLDFDPGQVLTTSATIHGRPSTSLPCPRSLRRRPPTWLPERPPMPSATRTTVPFWCSTVPKDRPRAVSPKADLPNSSPHFASRSRQQSPDRLHTVWTARSLGPFADHQTPAEGRSDRTLPSAAGLYRRPGWKCLIRVGPHGESLRCVVLRPDCLSHLEEGS